MEVATKQFESLRTKCRQIEDPRTPINIFHPVENIIAISIAAIVAGAEGPKSIARWAVNKKDWLQTWLDLPEGMAGVLGGWLNVMLTESAGDQAEVMSRRSLACVLSWSMPVSAHRCDMVTVSPLATQLLHSEVLPSPQSNLMFTLSPSGSVAADEKLAVESFATVDGPIGTAGVSGALFGFGQPAISITASITNTALLISSSYLETMTLVTLESSTPRPLDPCPLTKYTPGASARASVATISGFAAASIVALLRPAPCS